METERERSDLCLTADDNLTLHCASWCEFPFGNELDGSTEDELGTDRLFELPLELVQVTGLRAELYDDGDRGINRQPAGWQPDLEFTGDARAEGGDDVSDRAGEDVHAADDKHVIDTTDAADPDPSTAAFTSPYSLNSDEITNSEANQRDTLTIGLPCKRVQRAFLPSARSDDRSRVQ